MIGIDVETTAFNSKEAAFFPWQGHRIFAVTLASRNATHGESPSSEIETTYIRVRDEAGKVNPENLRLARILIREQNPCTWVGHNLKFDARFLAADDIYLSGNLVDTRVLSHLTQEDGPHDLVSCTERYLGSEEAGNARVGESDVKRWLKSARTKNYAELPERLLEPYARLDAELALRLGEVLMDGLDEKRKELWSKVEVPLTLTLLKAELRGVRVDVPLLKKRHVQYLEVVLGIIATLRKLLGRDDFEPTVTADLQWALLGELGLPVVKVTSKAGAPSFDSDALERYHDLDLTPTAEQVIKLLARFAGFNKLLTSFIAPYSQLKDDSGILHANFDQVGTRTGRLSCSKPNLMQLPLTVKELIIPRDGYSLICADYSQIEYRFFAHYAQDRVVTQTYRDDPTTDFHTMVSGMLDIERSPAKTVNFGCLYGMGKATMARKLHRSIEDAELLLNDYHRKFYTVRPLTRAASRAAERRGYVFNLYGRRRHLSRDKSYTALNAICQGGAGDLAKQRTLAVLEAVVGLDVHFLINVHDELVFEVPTSIAKEVLPIVVKVMEDVPELSIPVYVDAKIVDRWGPIRSDMP